VSRRILGTIVCLLTAHGYRLLFIVLLLRASKGAREPSKNFLEVRANLPGGNFEFLDIRLEGPK
jgi:hypothetical protein